jgi:hypothetical protein
LHGGTPDHAHEHPGHADAPHDDHAH